MTPATVEDAYTMLIEAVAIDDPVVYCEHKYLYYHLKADKLPTEGMPTGKARIAREGRDLSIVTYSAMVHEALTVAEEFARDGFEIEVVDLRSVKPLDTDTVLASVARTGRLLCVGEAFPWGGVTAEVIARVSTEGFHLPDAAPQWPMPRTPIPYHPILGRTPSQRQSDCAKGEKTSPRIEFMPQVPIIMPQLGESIAEATIVDIKVKPGDEVAADQEIIEVETNKAVMGVTTPCKGKIGNITAQVKETYPIGAVLGYVEASAADAARFTKTAPAPVQEEVAEEIPGRAEQEVEPARQNAWPLETAMGRALAGCRPAALKSAGFLSPRVRARMLELQLTTADLSGIPGTGAGNRVTVKDLESFLQTIEKQKLSDASAIRTGVADAMRRSWSRPLATIGSSVRLDALLQDRQVRDPKPGPALYAVRALALALAQNPAAAAKLIGGRVVTSDSIDIGVAVEAEDGIMVPVIAADKIRWPISLPNTLNCGARSEASDCPRHAGGRYRLSFKLRTFGVEWGTPFPA
jgi:hypothetical protein